MAKKSKSKSSKKSSSGSTIKKVGQKVLGLTSQGGGKSTGTRKKKGANYYANQLLVMRLKKKIYKLKYGGR